MLDTLYLPAIICYFAFLRPQRTSVDPKISIPAYTQSRNYIELVIVLNRESILI